MPTRSANGGRLMSWRGSTPTCALAASVILMGSATAGSDRMPVTQETATVVLDTVPVLASARGRSPEVLDPDPIGRIGAPLDAEASAWVERTLAALTLRQRVAQMVMPWVPGERSSPGSAEFQRMLRWVERDEVGGLIISRGPPDAIASRLNAAQARAAVPLLVTSDLESGPSMRLSPGGTSFPPAMAFAAANDLELSREAGRITGIEARSVGIHLTLGPVLDVNSNPLNPIINIRSFGEDAVQVGRLGTVWAAGAREAGLLAAAKHFPGHGATALDSHVRLPTLHIDPVGFDSVELAPFRFAIERGIDAILVGHIAVASVDGPGAPPASLSPRLIEGVLRTRLGFQGLVITDALNMGAITRDYTVVEASIRAVLAGADILLQPPGASHVIDALMDAVLAGRIPEERVDASARRILTAKAAAGLHRASGGARVDPALVRTRVGAEDHRAAAARLTSASIILVRDRLEMIPFRGRSGRILHLVSTGSGNASVGTALTRELMAHGFTVEVARVREGSGAAELRSIRDRASAADLIVATTVVAPRENRPLAVGTTFARLVKELSAAGRPVVAVSLGSPYILDAFPSVPAYLLAWSASEGAQHAAARALVGTAPIRGMLPVSLGADLPVGYGLVRDTTARMPGP